MKLFELHRDKDEGGISGTGVVAQGVIFDNGWCSLLWLTEHTSAAFYTSIEEVIAIHGHDGKTRVMQVADCSAEAINGIIGNCYQDNCENVHSGLNRENRDAVEITVESKDGTERDLASYLWDERQKFYNLFTPTNLATGAKHTGGI